MGAKDSKPKDMKQIVKETKVTEKEIKQYYKDFKQKYPSGQLSRAEFMAEYTKHFPHGDSQEFANSVFATYDKDGDQKLDFREFMTAVALGKGKLPPAEQLKWAFEMYDMDGSGQISMGECYHMIKSMLKLYSTAAGQDAQAQELTEKIFTTIDKNRDGKLSLQEFCDGARTDATLLTMLEGKPLI